ncbi:CHAT domain-containing protein [Belliella kenyensis]|uniref:CHAT domain-containing protein n=1 Tax=Belliella kenyensis TaxID=1472724 RepID=UPI00367072D6|nr:CHAT domain-containing protein [Belliella kenyensis]
MINFIFAVVTPRIQDTFVLEKYYQDRVYLGSKSIPDSILKPHYEYWSSKLPKKLQAQDHSDLFLFLATCHLEKKNKWSEEIIALLKSEDLQQFPKNDWRNSVVDYLDYLNQGAKIGKYEIDTLRKKLKMIKQASPSSPEWIGLATDKLGRTFYDHNQYDSALHYLETAGRIFESSGYKLYLVNNLTMQGVLWDAKEQFANAAKKYEASIEVLETLENPPLGTLGANAYNIGLIYDDRYGNSAKGIPFYYKALAYDSKGGKGNFGIVSEDYAALSRCYIKLGDLLKAEKYAKLSVQYANQIDPSSGFEYAKALLINAEVYNAKQQVSLGISKAIEALEIFKRIEKSSKVDLRRQRSLTNNLLGKIHLNAGNFTESKAYYTEAIKLAQEIERDVFLLESYPGLIQVAIEESDWKTALKQWEMWGDIIQLKFQEANYHIQLHELKGLEITFRSGAYENDELFKYRLNRFLDLPGAMMMHHLQALNLKTLLILNNSSDREEALQHLASLQKKLYEYLNFQHHVQNTALQLPELKKVVKNSLELGFSLSRDLPGDSLNLLIFNLISFNKSLGNIPKRIHSNAEKSASELLRSEAILSERYAEVSFMIHSHQAAQNIIKSQEVMELYREEQEIEEELLKIRDQLRLASEMNFYAHFASPAHSLKQVLSNIPKRELWVETFILDQDLYSIFLDQSKIELGHKKLSIDQIDQWKKVSRPSTGKLPISSMPQWNDLFDKDFTNFEKIIYVPDSWLSFMPLEAFNFGNNFLIHAVEIVYDVSLMDRFRRGTLASKKKSTFWTGFAPVYESKKLKYAKDEIVKIGQITQGKSFVGREVNKDLFKAEAAKASVFHLAAHGHTESSNPGFNAMIFGENLEDYLTVNEIYDWSIDSSLGVLSACSSGIVNVDEGAGLLSLGRAFHFAGVKALVISLWDIPDKQSALIMELFYKNLLQGMDSSTALRKAKIQYIQLTEDEVFKHPFYWAGLVLVGDELLETDQVSYWWLILIGLPLLLYLALRKFGK